MASLVAQVLGIADSLFDRPKDWVDIDEMANSGALDRTVAARRLESLLGRGDPRVGRLAAVRPVRTPRTVRRGH